MNTEIYCGVYIIICFVCADNLYYSCPIICHAMKYVNVVLWKSVDLVQLGSNAKKHNNALTVILNVSQRYSFCITFTPTAYATNDTTIIHHVYKPDFSLRSFFPRPEVGTCLPSNRRPSFFQVNDEWNFINYSSQKSDNRRFPRRPKSVCVSTGSLNRVIKTFFYQS